MKKDTQEFNKQFKKDAIESLNYGMAIANKWRHYIRKIVLIGLILAVVAFVIKLVILNT